jgi:hypothetical protein
MLDPGCGRWNFNGMRCAKTGMHIKQVAAGITTSYFGARNLVKESDAMKQACFMLTGPCLPVWAVCEKQTKATPFSDLGKTLLVWL